MQTIKIVVVEAARVLVFLLLMSIAVLIGMLPALGQDTPYSDRVIECRVIDGDSHELVLDLGYNLQYRVFTRVNGVDAPEKSTEAGKLVTKVHTRWLKERSSGHLVWHSSELDKFGRSLGDLSADGQSWAGFLIENELARPYFGGKRQVWSREALLAVETRCQALLQKKPKP